jgi:hypothetical protein
MSRVDAKLPAMSGVGILAPRMIPVEELRLKTAVTPEKLEPPEVSTFKAKESSMNIRIPLEAIKPPEITVMVQDPNIASAMAQLTAPRIPGETTLGYEQRRAAAERMQPIQSPAPAFMGKAGERLKTMVESPGIRLNTVPK